MTESEWTLDTDDAHRIYGVRAANQESPNSAIFIVHGLTCSMEDYALKRASDFFADNHAVYRFNLYDGRENGRTLVNCTLETHAADLKRILEAFAGNYRKVFLIGHSYGGPTIMIANPQNITAASLWDPSFDLQATQTEFAKNYTKIEQGYLVDYGIATLMGQPMYDEMTRFNEEACINLAKTFNCPLQVIHAGDGILIKRKSYHSYCSQKIRHDIIAGTKHTFSEGRTCDDLLNKTKAWFDLF